MGLVHSVACNRHRSYGRGDSGFQLLRLSGPDLLARVMKCACERECERKHPVGITLRLNQSYGEVGFQLRTVQVSLWTDRFTSVSCASQLHADNTSGGVIARLDRVKSMIRGSLGRAIAGWGQTRSRAPGGPCGHYERIGATELFACTCLADSKRARSRNLEEWSELRHKATGIGVMHMGFWGGGFFSPPRLSRPSGYVIGREGRHFKKPAK